MVNPDKKLNTRVEDGGYATTERGIQLTNENVIDVKNYDTDVGMEDKSTTNTMGGWDTTTTTLEDGGYTTVVMRDTYE